MSVVTNFMLTGLYLRNENNPLITRLNAYLKEHKHDTFREVSTHAGGKKALETHVWLLACNHITTEQVGNIVDIIANYVRARKFDGSGFQLFVNQQDELTWQQYYPFHVKLTLDDEDSVYGLPENLVPHPDLRPI